MSVKFLTTINRVLGHEGGYVNDPTEGSCSVKGCPRDSLAKGLCNTHYLRSRKGQDMSAPITNRQRDSLCKECGEPTNSKGGWGLCSKHYRKRRNTRIKETLVELMGGKCSCCDKEYPLAVYDFHHTRDKLYNPSELISNGSVAEIAEELSKCVLLCANCHRIVHSCP